MKISRLFLATAVLLVFAADASAQSVEGKWSVEYPTRVASRNGESHVEAMGTATLTFDRISGDSVYGSWLAANVQDPTKKNDPRRVAGTFSNGKLVMLGAPVEAQLRRSGGGGSADDHPTSIIMRTYFEGTLNGDDIEGTMYSKSEDEMVTSSPTKWTAKRVAAK